MIVLGLETSCDETGSRGTGKSSIVRALLTKYANQGLRLIEIERDDLSELPEIQKIIQHVIIFKILLCIVGIGKRSAANKLTD